MQPVCIFTVTGKNREEVEAEAGYGVLYAADIKALGEKPQSEIAEVICVDRLPEDLNQWAYPDIEPVLVKKLQEAKTMHIIENVPFISQLVKYPTGCESVSTTMALNYLGCPITPEEVMDNLLPKGPEPTKGEDGVYYGPDPWKVFPGSPYSDDGWGCFAPVVSGMIAKLDGYKATEYYGLTIDELCQRFIDNDQPVVFWATINMATPRKALTWQTDEGRTIQWINPMHCLLLIGYDENGYYFNDPTAGERAYFPKEQVKICYEAQGKQAVVIERA